jgi:nucleoid-associated protein YgaU
MKLLKILLLLSLVQVYSCSKSADQAEDSDDPAGVEIADSGEESESGDDSLDGEALEEESGDEVKIAEATEEDGEVSGDGEESVAGTSVASDDVALDETQNLEEVAAPSDSAQADSGSDYVASSAAEEPAGSSSVEAATSDTSGIGDATYSVQSNETLMLIAFKLYGDYGKWKEIASLNQDKLNGSTLISTGMQLRYNTQGANFNWSPSGKEHIVKSGDTLSLISNHYYATIHKWKQIWENNKPLIKDPNKIFVGFTIFVPEQGMRDMASDPQPAAPPAMPPAQDQMAQGAAPAAEAPAAADDFGEDI